MQSDDYFHHSSFFYKKEQLYVWKAFNCCFYSIYLGPVKVCVHVHVCDGLGSGQNHKTVTDFMTVLIEFPFGRFLKIFGN